MDKVFQLFLRYRPGKYFVLGSFLFWLSVQAIYARIQYIAQINNNVNVAWFDIFVFISPWFCSWIGLTLIVYIVTRCIDTLLLSRSWRVTCHLLVMLVLLSAYWLLTSGLSVWLFSDYQVRFYGAEYQGFVAHLCEQISDTFQLDVMLYLGVLSACKGILYYHDHIHEKMEVKRLQHALLNEQLKTLRTQLNPHFLFNALNTVASLVRLKRENQAIKALSELSYMLRQVLENQNNEDVMVKDEMAFINAYLAIQYMRFEDKLDIVIKVDESCQMLRIPNMLLHPLIENAIQHSSQLESDKNPISLDIRCEAGQLRILVVNKVADRVNTQGSDHAVSTTRDRLSNLYNESNYTLEQRLRDDGSAETLVIVPVETEAK